MKLYQQIYCLLLATFIAGLAGATKNAKTKKAEPAKAAAPAGGLSMEEEKKYRDNIPKTDAEIVKKIGEKSFKVMKKEDTELPFKNDYFDKHDSGLYVDRISGEPLFLSANKYDSHTGWPSFTKPITEEAVFYKGDTHVGYERKEVRSKISDSHLGHVFDDGPDPDDRKDGNGRRFCMNSASLRFIPKTEMKKEGYEKYIAILEKAEKEVKE